MHIRPGSNPRRFQVSPPLLHQFPLSSAPVGITVINSDFPSGRDGLPGDEYDTPAAIHSEMLRFGTRISRMIGETQNTPGFPCIDFQFPAETPYLREAPGVIGAEAPAGECLPPAGGPDNSGIFADEVAGSQRGEAEQALAEYSPQIADFQMGKKGNVRRLLLWGRNACGSTGSGNCQSAAVSAGQHFKFPAVTSVVEGSTYIGVSQGGRTVSVGLQKFHFKRMEECTEGAGGHSISSTKTMGRYRKIGNKKGPYLTKQERPSLYKTRPDGRVLHDSGEGI